MCRQWQPSRDVATLQGATGMSVDRMWLNILLPREIREMQMLGSQHKTRTTSRYIKAYCVVDIHLHHVPTIHE